MSCARQCCAVSAAGMMFAQFIGGKKLFRVLRVVQSNGARRHRSCQAAAQNISSPTRFATLRCDQIRRHERSREENAYAQFDHADLPISLCAITRAGTQTRGSVPMFYPMASRHSASERCRHVYIGVSRKVNELALLSRNSCTKSRKSDGSSVSKATTNS